MYITDMGKNGVATIISLIKLDPKFRARLMDIGIYENAEVTLINKLAFEKLFLIEIDDIEICLRKEDARLIEVR